MQQQLLQSLIFCAVLFVGANTASAEQCRKGRLEPTAELLWVCPSNTTLKNADGSFFSRTAAGRSACDASCARQPKLAEGDYLDAYPIENASWRRSFESSQLLPHEAYTTLELIFEQNPPVGTCSNYGFFDNIIGDLIGRSSTHEITLSIVLSERPLPRDFKIDGLAIPLYSFTKSVSGKCSVNRVFQRDLTLTRLRADREIYLTPIYVETSSDVLLRDSEASDLTSLLTSAMNGTMKGVVPIVSTVLGADGARVEIASSNTFGTRINLAPRPDGDDALMFKLVQNGNILLSFQVRQNNKVTSLAELESAQDNLTSALRVASVADRSSDSVIKPLTPLVSILPRERVDLSVVYRDDATIKDVRRACNDLSDFLDEYQFSTRAKNTLLALVMRQYHTPSDFETSRTGRLACVPYSERSHYDKLYDFDSK